MLCLQINFNGLKSFLDKYRHPALDQPLLGTNDNFDQWSNAVAIVGISCRFPKANSMEEFWKLLIEGGDAIAPVPSDRWTLENCPIVPENAEKSTAGFLNTHLDEFDGKFFGMSPMELSTTDPQQRVLLQIAWEALENAGIDPISLKDSYTGVYGGSWRTDYREMIQDAESMEEGEFLRIYLGNSIGVLTARISHVLGLTGPSISTESGCSSSMVAVDLACKSLQRGETDLSLACGINLILRPFTGKSMSTVLAPDGHCKTFDANADGFGRAEGCGVLVLKRYADAVRDGDRVHALIRGSAVVQEGASRSLGTPTKYCEALAMRMALEDAGVEPKDVSYVETHGTGTPVGDPLEVAAVAEVYAKQRNTPLTIGSVKTNIGHTESCSGIAGIIKVVLSMQNEMIPPHRNFETLNPAINLDSIPAQIPLTAQEWKRNPEGKPRIAGVSSFGITGTDAHVIVQEAPDCSPYQKQLLSEPERPVQILSLSARSEEALEDQIRKYRTFLAETTGRLQDITYTANTGRAHFPFRVAVVGKSINEMLHKLKTPPEKQIPEVTPKVCFLFTGQGSQYPGMAKSLYESSLVFRTAFDQCDELLELTYGISIRNTLWGNNSANLGRTLYSQTSIFVIEYCLLKLWESWGVKPDYVLGHSLGEFGAAVAAGILKFKDALKLVAERSRLIDGLPGGKMLVMKESREKVDSLIKTAFKGSDRWLDYAAVNSPEQTVVAGSEENVKFFAEFCKNNQIKTHILDATHAFHSRHMDPILDEYRKVASKVKYMNPKCVFVSGMEGRIVEEDGHVNADYWVRHTRDSVRFADASKAIMEKGCGLFLEIGPQPVLSALTMMNSDGVEGLEQPVVCLPSIRRQDEDWPTMLSTLANLYLNGIVIDWKGYYQFSDAKKITLPCYPFQNKRHWFEIAERGPAEIHPLVGTPLSNASAMKLFSNKLNVNDRAFLKDHVIGNKIIFPGAGFMEMCLVSGHAATQCSEAGYFAPVAPITLENFVIESPLGLNETEFCQLQVIVSSEDSGETRITVYSKLVLDKETHKWIRHATATFTPYAVEDKPNEERGLVGTLDEIKSRCTNYIKTEETYSKLSEFGLKFGPTFQTLKGAWKGEKEVLFEVAVTDDPSKYICHPVVTDALFQAIMITANPESPKLHVPVSVSKFVSFAPIASSEEPCYIHCIIEDGDIIASLYDFEQQLLARMTGATLIETTVATIMSALEAQRVSLPSMYEDVWRAQIGPLERRADPEKVFNQGVFDVAYQTALTNKYCSLSQEESDFLVGSNKLYGLYMIKAFLELGLCPRVGQSYDFQETSITFGVKPTIKSFFKYMFDEMQNDGYFETLNDDIYNPVYKCVKEFPLLSDIEKTIEKLYAEVTSFSPLEVELVSLVGKKMTSCLTGKESALPILFPEDPNVKADADAYYREARLSLMTLGLGQEWFPYFLRDCGSILDETKTTIRILEVGAGTGSFTKSILPHLVGNSEGYEYTYTDLSQVFFQSGQKVFEESRIKVVYKILNIEQDPFNQGFIPHHYDLIIANNVIHATKDISLSVRNLRNLLRDNGMLMITESIRPIRATTIIFGLLDAYWPQIDTDLRPHHCILTPEKWTSVLSLQGFGSIGHVKAYDGYVGTIVAKAKPLSTTNCLLPTQTIEASLAWVVFSDGGKVSNYFIGALKEQGVQVVTITNAIQDDRNNAEELNYAVQPTDDAAIEDIFKSLKVANIAVKGALYFWGIDFKETDYTNVLRPYLNLCKVLLPMDKPKLHVFTNGIINIGDHDLALPTASPLWAMTKCFQNEQPNSSCRCVDMEYSDEPTEDQIREAMSELYTDDHEIFVAYRSHKRQILRFTPLKFSNSALSFPKTERFHLVLPPTRAINDLKFGAVEKLPIGDDQVEIRVKCFALNFRDVLTVLKPIQDFENFHCVGIDFSGIVTAVGPTVSKIHVGDPVFGSNMHGDAMPSHVVLTEDSVFRIPQSMTYCEAATVPVVASTAVHCLIKVANLTKDDTILIHTGSGGVGILAIQIASHIGATIVTTAGSKRKRAYLRGLGIKHIFNSRTTSYEQDIREALNGKGVDVVLNSLTSEGFKEASLALCNEGARFIEMSKLNIWTLEEVKALRPDVKYDIVDLSAAPQEHLISLMEPIRDLMNNDVIQPLPYVRFDAAEIREALTYLQKARHVGKIVCVMPEPDGQVSGASSLVTPMFNDRSSYLITGGLGGIGFEVAKWMAQSGAKYIVLAGRNPPNEKVAEEIHRINSNGKNIVVMQADVSDYEQCKSLLQRIESELPPLRGVMHAAGVLTDAVFSNQTWEKYERTLNPKIRGGWNLHQLTLHYRLEHFVMYSSAVSSFGSMGQSNHAAANFFLDSLAYYRNSIGLPATTVNWGQWGQVGVAANMEIIGLKPFSVLQGVSALERALKSQRLQCLVAEMDMAVMKQLFPSVRRYLEELKMNQNDKTREIHINNEQFWNEYDAATTDESRSEVIRGFVRLMIRQILKLDKDEPLNDEENFQDLGMDSLMMIEMKNVVQSTIGKRATITVNSVKDCHNINELTAKLIQLLSGEDIEMIAPTREEFLQLVKEDSLLPSHIVPAGLPCLPSKIRTVLITGVTGNMGPYLLRDIANRAEIQKVFCLVRSENPALGEERLRKVLDRKNLLPQIPMSKVVCLSGTVTQQNLGLNDHDYSKMSEEIDAVVHLAVKSNFTDLYRKIDKGDTDLRTVNYKGTLNVLEFVCSIKTKVLFHASSIVANGSVDEETRLSEAWPTADEFDEMPNSAYPVSKYVCDRLMAQAVERGIPVKVFRFPAVGGDSKTGANVTYDNNQLMLRLMSYLSLGYMPALPLPFFILPVDVCSNLSLRVFFNDSAPYDMYNVYNPFSCNETEFISIAEELGYHVDIVEPDVLLSRLSEEQESSKLVHSLKIWADNKEMEERLLTRGSPAITKAWTKNPHGAFLSTKLSKFCADEYPSKMEKTLVIIRRDLLQAKSSGLFEKMGV
jgi:thioester reductase-like protein